MQFGLDTSVLPVRRRDGPDFCAHCSREIKGANGNPPRVYHLDGATYHQHCHNLVRQTNRMDDVLVGASRGG